MPRMLAGSLALLIALSISLPAQTADSQSAAPVFQSGARLALVPVVVRDKNGRAVTDVNRASFQLFDNGKPQAIASFEVEHGVAANGTGVPDHFTAYFFDDLALNDAAAIGPLREAALKSLANLQSGDRVAILTTSCRVVQDFTGDRAMLEQAIGKLSPDPYPTCRTAPAESLEIALLRDAVHRMKALPGERSIVILSSGFRLTGAEQSAGDRLIDEAIEAQVSFHALHVASNASRKQYASDMTGRNTWKSATDRMMASKVDDPSSMYQLAQGTGGQIVEAANALDVAFRKVATPECYYVLGFAPESAADGKYRKLKVVLKDSRLTVRAREGYYAARPPATLPALPVPAESQGESSEVTLSSTTPVAPPQPVAERSTARQPVLFTAHANLVLVPVVVRDKNGRAVGNLEKGNFEIRDKGERQEIAMFNVEKRERAAAAATVPPAISPAPPAPVPAQAPAPPPAVPDTFIAYVFDDVHITFADLSQVREAAWKNIQETLAPSVRIAIVTTSGRGLGKDMVDFTDDREKIHSALYHIVPNPVFRPVCHLCGELAYLYGYLVDTGTDWKRPIPVKGLINGVRDDGASRMKLETRALSAVEWGERETELSLDTLRLLSRRMASMAGSRTILLLGHGFFVTHRLKDELANTIDQAIRAGVIIDTLNSSGLMAGPESFGSGWDDDRVAPDGNPYAHEAALYGSMTLGEIADGTGGIAIENSNDYLGGIRQLAAPPEYRYVTGISPRNLVADGAFHRLKIGLTGVDRKGLTIVARRGYYAPSRAADLTDAVAKQIENAVFTRDDLRDLPVEMRTEAAHPEGGIGEISVLTDVDLKLLRYRQSEGRNCEDVTAVVAIFDRDGNFIEGKQQLLELRLRDETMANLEKQAPETLKTTFHVDPGAYLVRLVVRSGVQQTMTTIGTLVRVP
jgi:VWFA-related protein